MLIANKSSETILIKAFDLGLIELDEHHELNELKHKLQSYSANKNIYLITLDLRRCYVEYATTYIFLDESIQLLQQSEIPEKKLIIKFSIDLNSSETMFQCFRACKALHNKEVNDKNFSEKLAELFSENNIDVSIYTYNFNSFEDSDIPENTYKLE